MKFTPRHIIKCSKTQDNSEGNQRETMYYLQWNNSNDIRFII